MNARERKRSDRLTLAAAFGLLLAIAGTWFVWGSQAREQRKVVLAGVPDFPQPGQVSHRRLPVQPEPRVPLPARVATRVAAPDAGPIPPRRVVDKMTAFALAPASTLALVRVNALVNTPIYERFKQCIPDELKGLQENAQLFDLDPERDIDSVALIRDGVALSGFFEGKPLAEQLARSQGAEPTQRTYRGQTLWGTGRACVVQLGNLLLSGRAERCEALVDRALDPPAEAANPDELYGDLYLRDDLTGLRAAKGQGALSQDESDVLGGLLDSLSGVTVRANVWDQVALSVEGAPQQKGKLRELVQMSRGALSVAKGQLAEDDVRLQTLADLARVTEENGNVKIDLALPVDELFERLHWPCPGADGGAP